MYFRKSWTFKTTKQEIYTQYNSLLERTSHFTYCHIHIHILCQGARHLKSSKEAQGTQEAQSIHRRG